MDLANKLDDSINRIMRGNLVFLNIPEEEGENPITTKQIHSEELANNFTQKSPEIILQHIVRAHRSPPRPGNKSPRPIFAKFTREDIAEDINEDLSRIKSFTKCMRQYTKSLQERRNRALINRRELLSNKAIIKRFY